jgi:hypothetical protein
MKWMERSIGGPGWNFIPARPADSQLRRTTRTICLSLSLSLSLSHTHTHIYKYIYILLSPDDGLLASPKHVEVQLLSEVKINIASGWFYYTQKSNIYL